MSAITEVEESSSSDEEDISSESDAEENNEHVAHLKLLPYSKVKEGDWVKVVYEGEVFLGKTMKKQAGEVLVRCLEKPFAVGGPRNLKREDSSVFYELVCEANVIPELKQFGRAWQYTY